MRCNALDLPAVHRYAVQRGGRALLADEMGLGKTLQAMSVAAYFRDDWPLLVCCPASLW